MSRFMISNCRNRGSVLIEALLTVSILAIGLTVVIQSFLSSLRANVSVRDYSIAMILLESKMSELLLNGFIDDNVIKEESFMAPYQKFRYQLQTHTANLTTTNADLNEVQLKVSWLSGHKRNSIPATTYLFKVPK